MTETTGKRDSSDEGADRQIHELSSDVANAVRGAADVFERELSSSLAGARTLQRQLFDDHRVHDEDFAAVTGRFRETAHQTIAAFSDRLADQSAEENKDLVHRFSRDAQDAFDAFIELVDKAPSLINFFAKSAENLGERINTNTPAPGTGEPGHQP
jgi:hypothetical protein